jgi:hypothetical protein
MCIADPLKERLFRPQHSRAEVFVRNAYSRHFDVVQIPIAKRGQQVRVMVALSVYMCGSIWCLLVSFFVVVML